MKKRSFLIILAACAAAAILSGCKRENGQGGNAVAPSESGELSQMETSPAESVSSRAPSETAADTLALSPAELADWGQYLSGQGVCELFRTPFASPDEINLAVLFYDGLPDGAALAEEERGALEEIAGEIQLDVVKVTAEEIMAQFRALTGAELTAGEVKERMTGWYYLADYDAYYHIHGDTNMVRVSCTAGSIRSEDGSMVLTCYLDEDKETVYTVGLTETKEAYQFAYLLVGEN